MSEEILIDKLTQRFYKIKDYIDYERMYDNVDSEYCKIVRLALKGNKEKINELKRAFVC